jgi:hypothetical protein
MRNQNHGWKPMIRVIAVAAFALALTTSAQAITLAPLHLQNGVITQVREACGAGMHRVNGVCVTTPARRQVRRCLVWGAGHVCRKWG